MHQTVLRRVAALVLGAATVFLTVYGLGIQGRPPAPPQGEVSRSLPEDDGPPTEPLAEESLTMLLCGLDETEGLTDVILLARYDRVENAVDLLQIPRDSYVGEASVTGKINGVYSRAKAQKEDGVEALRALLEEQFLLPIDYGALVTLEGVRSLVDAYGGIKVDLPQAIDYLPGKTLPAGPQVLDGEKAEWFLRYRKGYAMGDLGRLKAQQVFLQAVLDTVRQGGRGKALRVVMGHYPQVETDLPLSKAMSLASALFGGTPPEVRLWLLEGTGGSNGPYQVYEIDRQAAADLLNERFRPADQPVDVGMLGIPALPKPPDPVSQPQETADQETETPPAESRREDVIEREE